MMKPKFITIEGIEGVGKTTAVACISNYLNEKQIEYITTREPGGTKIGEGIRQVLLNQHDEKMANDTELLLMFACRAQNIHLNILPALEQGRWVICDRFTDASYAYQGGGRGIDLNRIAILEQCVQEDLRPDLILLLTAPVELALQRANSRSAPDRIEREKADFFTRVQDMYLQRAEQNPNRYKIIDASQPLEQVENDIINQIRLLNSDAK